MSVSLSFSYLCPRLALVGWPGQVRKKSAGTRKQQAGKLHARAHRLEEAVRPDDVFSEARQAGVGELGDGLGSQCSVREALESLVACGSLVASLLGALSPAE